MLASMWLFELLLTSRLNSLYVSVFSSLSPGDSVVSPGATVAVPWLLLFEALPCASDMLVEEVNEVVLAWLRFLGNKDALLDRPLDMLRMVYLWDVDAVVEHELPEPEADGLPGSVEAPWR
ncbi:hypothetical protein K439DRAFT_1617151 [Ramaria rubella]|nr:hypothetical protein K439DRAFT_1617151 [Ramaria rubella]